MTNGWQEVPLKEIANPISRSVPVEGGTEYRTIGVKWWGMGAYERETIDGSRTAAKTLSIVREGDLIINKIWVRHGSVAIAGKEVDGCAGSGEFPTFELDLNRIEPRWIHWQTKMKSFWGKCDSLSQGTSGKNRIKPELFLTIKIPLPPLDEQRNIVERVEALAARIAEVQFLREETNKETDLLFARTLSGAYDEALSIAGSSERLDALCTTITDGTHVTPYYVDEGIPFLSVKDVSSGKIDFSRARFISPEEHAFLTKRCKPERDDILLTKVGTTGIAKVVDVDREFSIFVSIALLKLDKTRLNSKFTEYMLNSPKLKQYSSDGTRGVGNKNLVLKFIKEFPMPVPPLDEQRRIVAYLDSVQARLASLRELQSATGEELSALLPSVLDRAFKGEL